MSPLPCFTMLVAIALVAIFFAPSAGAQELPQYRCEPCRDLRVHPEDARNFAANMIYGRNSFLGFADTNFELADRFGNVIEVDINAEFVRQSSDWSTFQDIIRKDLFLRMIDDLFVRDIVFQILLYYPNGDSYVYKLLRSKLNRLGSLPVPADSADTADSTSSGAGETGSGSGGSPGEADYREFWREYQADWEESYGFPVCWGDFRQPDDTAIVCRRWP